MLVSKSTVDFKSWSRSGLPAGKLFCCKSSKCKKGTEKYEHLPWQKQWNQKLPYLLPTGIFPSWDGKKKELYYYSFSTDTDRPLPKAGVNNPQPWKQHFLAPTSFPCNVCTFAQMNTQTHAHTHTIFLGWRFLHPYSEFFKSYNLTVYPGI